MSNSGFLLIGSQGPAGADGADGVVAAINAYESGGGQVITAGPTTVGLDTIRGAPAGWAINGGNALELTDAAQAGNYAIVARMGGDGSADDRTAYDTFLTKNGTEITGSRTQCTVRGGAMASGNTAPMVATVTLALNDTIDIRVVRTGGSSNYVVQPDGVTIMLMKVQ